MEFDISVDKANLQNLLDNLFQIADIDHVKEVVEERHKLDILINASGVLETCPFLYETEEMWARVWRINYEGPVVFCQAAIRYMIGGGGGQILNIATVLLPRAL